MQRQQETINFKVKKACRRWRQLVLLKGGCKVVVLTLLTFLAANALETMFELDMAARVSLFVALAVVFIFSVTRFIVVPLRHLPGKYEIARYIEEKHPQLEDRLITAVEVGETSRVSGSEVLLQKLMEDTQLHIEPLNFTKALKSSTTLGWGVSAAVMLLLILVVLFFDPVGFSLNSGRVLAPWQFPTVQPVAELVVTPGTAHVPKGSAQRIHAKLNGFESAAVFLYYSTSDSSWNKVKMDATMEENRYLFNFFDLQSETKYYVKADDRLSDVYTFTVYEAPRITRVDVTYTYPSYTKLPPKTERDNGDVWAPEGTVVKIRAVTDKPVTRASFVLGDDRTLATTITRDTVVTATLSVKEDSYYKIAVTDIDNLTNEPPPEYYIHAQPDEPPVLSIEWPGRDLKSSMLEEVPLRIRVADDFSVPELKLKYVVNDEPEEREVVLAVREIQSPDSNDDSDREFETTHLFYLEDIGVEPGDFISYYVQAGDSHSADAVPLTSDLYFIEVRPFRLEFQRPLSQQQGAGGPTGGRLSETQREIFIATSKTQRKSKKADRDELTADLEILVESQKNLMEVTESTLSQLQQRSAFTRDGGQNVTEHYTQAVQSMQEAIDRLEGGDLVSAQVPERESLTELLHAEGQIEKVQIQQGQRGSQAQSASMDELAQLFQDEMDNLKNKYETLDKPEATQQPNEAFNKVKELARRQQDFNRKMRDLARSGLSEQEKKRRIEELRREQEKIRRETQELTRQMRQQSRRSGGLSRDMQDNLKQASSDMSDASHNLRNENTELAAAKGTRALNRLNQLQEMLKRNQKDSLRRQLSDLDKEVQRLTGEQRDLSQEVNNLAQASGNEAQRLDKATRKQHDLREQFTELEKRVQSLRQNTAGKRDEMSRNMKKVADDLARAGVSAEMKKAGEHLERKQLNSASQAEKDILAKLKKTGKQLTQLRNSLAETEEEKLDLALNQTQRVRDELETLKRQSQNQHGDQGTSTPTESRGKPSGRSGTSAGGGSGKSLETAQTDLLNEQLARSAQDLKMMQRSLRADTSLARQAGNLSDRIDGLLRSFTGGLPERMTQIQRRVLIPLKGLEAELSQRLELIKNREKFFLAREEKVPPGYQDLVEKYYEALSKTK